MQKTTIAKDIDLAGAKAGYDTCCKHILSNKVVLAWILKKCTDEYRDCSIEEIAERYIVSSPEVASVPVHADDLTEKPIDGRIIGTQNEDSSVTEKISPGLSFDEAGNLLYLSFDLIPTWNSLSW
ncbi:MAG: hypothetical protein ACI4WY_13040 [Anaerovoracaceae bacterium]